MCMTSHMTPQITLWMSLNRYPWLWSIARAWPCRCFVLSCGQAQRWRPTQQVYTAFPNHGIIVCSIPPPHDKDDRTSNTKGKYIGGFHTWWRWWIAGTKQADKSQDRNCAPAYYFDTASPAAGNKQTVISIVGGRWKDVLRGLRDCSLHPSMHN